MPFDKKAHWENIYTTKHADQVSWYQPNPETSLNLIADCNLSKNAEIIDVGAGDGFLSQHLMDQGYTKLSVLDISHASLERAIERFGEKAESVEWIEYDIVDFRLNNYFDLWHDRAAFHFLTDDSDITAYIENAYQSLKTNGSLIIGTFSDQGPTKCSGIEIKQYSISDLIQRFHPYFVCLDSLNTDHITPFDTNQNFTYCRFRKV